MRNSCGELGAAYDLPLPGDMARPLPAPAWSLALQLDQALAGELHIAQPSRRVERESSMQGVAPPGAQEARQPPLPVHTAKRHARAQGPCRLRLRLPLSRASPRCCCCPPHSLHQETAPASPAPRRSSGFPELRGRWGGGRGGSCSPLAEEGAGEGGLRGQRCLTAPLA